MIAYNPTWLTNLFIRDQVKEAFHQSYLDKSEYDFITSQYPVHFYTTNLFIRIGLFLLTVVIVLFSFGLLMLLMLNSIEHTIGGMAIFLGLVTYGALEYMVKTKNHFQSGVDDALLWISAGTLFGGISYLVNSGALTNCLIVFIISFYCVLRFADRLMALVLFASLLGILFFTVIRLGPLAKLILPFVQMAISIVIYLVVKRMKLSATHQVYKNCLQIITVSALLSFYLSGNYFVVRELSNLLFNFTPGKMLPLGWLFWILTCAIPCLYILNGIKKKDVIFIRVGLLLVAVIVFTVRYYYSILSPEVALTVGGMVLMVVSLGLTRYLKIPKFGFTYLETDATGTQGKLQIESLLQVQALSGQPTAPEATRFGGGNFGGGGGSGEF